MHPADIFKEVQSLPIFKALEKELLLQICTWLRPIQFNQGDIVITEGQTNSSLYFLRSGEVEVLVGNERVRILRDPGEVFGEMSVLSKKTTSATVRALTKCDFFYVSADDFTSVHPSQMDSVQLMLYRIYTAVLNDRLIQTNEKAKLFEKTARDLEKAKRDLESITQGQMNFLLTEAQKSHSQKKVLLFDSNKKFQMIAKSALGGTGVLLEIADNEQSANDLLKSSKFDLIFCNATSWHQINATTIDPRFVLTSPIQIEFETLERTNQFGNFITYDLDDRSYTSKTLLTTLSKLLNNDLFGLQKYLSWGVELVSREVKHSADRETLRNEMISHFKTRGVRGSLMDRAQVAMEEMLMNAIYDAPVDAAGVHSYNHLPRTVPVQLSPSQFGTLRYGMDGVSFAVSVEDPFGSLSREILIKYLKSCYSGAAGSLNTNKGGAGRGLHQITESADLTVFNVRAGQRTEVICQWSLDSNPQKKSAQPTMHFFFN